MTQKLISGLTFLATVLAVLTTLAVILFVITQIVSPPARRYKLPNGKIVECKYFEETSKGNYVLKDCEDGVEYYTNGTVEVLR